MKNYILSISILLISSSWVLITPRSLQQVDTVSPFIKIPENNAAVAGIQTFVTTPLSRNLPLPPFTAKSVVVYDINSQSVLYQKDAEISLPIASTTKIMTALVASEHFRPNSVLVVDKGASITGSSVGLTKGESLSFRALLYGMLLNSGNDAAYTIAENYPGGVDGFVAAMNKKATTLNLMNTHFDNPAGFDSPNHYSSGMDLKTITKEALKDAQLARIFATKETDIFSLDKKYHHTLLNLNKLLGDIVGVKGIKTGYTPDAKENLVTLIDRNDRPLIIIVLGSDDRFGETTKLIDWIYQNYTF